MALPVSEVAGRHGAYQLEADGLVRRVFYKASTEELLKHAALPPRKGVGGKNSGDDLPRTPKVCGVVFFDAAAASQLLHLAFDPLFEACSFLGIDNGASPTGFSLYLDLLASVASEVDLGSFAPADAAPPLAHLRRQLWHSLHRRIRLKAVVAERDDPSQYHCVRSTHDFVKLISDLQRPSSVAQSFFQAYVEDVEVENSSKERSCGVHASACIVNSVLRGDCKVAEGAIIESSALEDCHVGTGAICTGLKHMKDLDIPSSLSLQQVALMGTERTNGANPCCLLTLMIDDEARKGDFDGTFLGQTWNMFFANTGLSPQDLWPGDVSHRTLQSARLFPVVSASDINTLSSASTCQSHTQSGLCLAWLWIEYVRACRAEPAADRTVRLDLWRRRWLEVFREAGARKSMAEIAELADVSSELEWQDAVTAETNVLRVKHLLLKHADQPISHILQDEVGRGRLGLLDIFDDVASDPTTPLDVAARALSQVAEVLATLAGTRGGLRSGSARNPQWRGALTQLASHDPANRAKAVFEMKEIRSRWLKDGPVALIRAARHYEAAAQVLILTAVATCGQFIKTSPAKAIRPPGCWAVVESPARIDIAGGWTDTPPICYEHGGAVMNLAIRVDGSRPIGARALRMTDQLELILETWSQDHGSTATPGETACVCRRLADLEDFNSPSAPAALLKCCILCCGIVSITAGGASLEQQLREAGGGLRVASWSHLPQGSGLGSSSILAAAVIRALIAAFSLHMDDESVIHAVQNVEQMLTTGGGWQDQVGAVIGGAKICRSAASLPLQVIPECLPMSDAFAEELSSRLVLIFTGRPRLAKHLLQNVIRQWFGRAPEICEAVRGLVKNAEDSAEAIKSCDVERVGACLSRYWAQKKVMAPGCEPQPVAALRERLEPGLLGFSLTGAGGGGFAVLLTKEPLAYDWVKEHLANSPGLEGAYICKAAIDTAGMTLCDPAGGAYN
eukprot:TRINITY_DN104049_c0_g1_i1.p1 TRINITY_DN104049_c0_g1~~TRINITY_DN104049_c0_g1_i1.p1  ORF type:complete len:1022 (-),score=170.14 TRINITY_DN104049_c0_g1_i1:48-2945(-)